MLGPEQFRLEDAPDGVFTQVAGGASTPSDWGRCTVACWVTTIAVIDAPDGVFTQVAGGVHHSLGLREDTVHAGAGTTGQRDAPDGVFTQVAGGGYHSIDFEDGTVALGFVTRQCDARRCVYAGRGCIRQSHGLRKMAPLHAGA